MQKSSARPKTKNAAARKSVRARLLRRTTQAGPGKSQDQGQAETRPPVTAARNCTWPVAPPRVVASRVCGCGLHRSRPSEHGFSRPTAPVTREVAIPEAITVADLAKAMAVKAGEVIKVLMGMGIMVTINQSLDQDTAILVVEEMGHTAKPAEEKDIEQRTDCRRRSGGRRGRKPSARGDRDGSRRSRQDLAARLHPQGSRGRRRGRRHHAAHRRLPRGNRARHHHLPGHPGPRGLYRDARPRRPGDRHCHPGGGRRRRRDAADQGSHSARPRRRHADHRCQSTRSTSRTPTWIGFEPNWPARKWCRKTGAAKTSSSTSPRSPAKVSTSLLENVLLQAEVLELKANPKDMKARGVVVESSLDKGRGPIATLLIQAGTLQKGRHDPGRPGIRPRARHVRREWRGHRISRAVHARRGAGPVGRARRRRRDAGRGQRAQGARSLFTAPGPRA